MIPRLFCLVDITDALALLPRLAEVGVDGFQIRAKALPATCVLDLTERVIAAARPAGAVVVVNDRLDIALAAGADGVHLGATDLPVADARRIAPGLLVGGTCRNAEQVRRAAVDGASYAGFGPVFASASKAGLPDPLGTDAIAEAAGGLPLIAIGGLDVRRAAEARAAGAHGIAVIGAIWRQPDPVQAAKELVAAVA
ncbi:thiamine phosphate synthase [Nocardioides sp. InS609-2]|uniref:thiamine phosphate synthase n=1 Tax=Nocardioides sp. InS609-2 TaxID=2760705 RepID=UPI0020BEA8A7|nr:thiamine phosphate synthase [Nocardioides sp. InS609-2]